MKFGCSLLAALAFNQHIHGFQEVSHHSPASWRMMASTSKLLKVCRRSGSPRQLAAPSPVLADGPFSEELPMLSKIPPPPPISMPVWSLAALSSLGRPTQNAGDGDPSSSASTRTSMNIVTFAIPVSVAPPKLWMVSLYHGTLTKDSFCESGCGVLQLLTPRHKGLVDVLGKHSGHDAEPTTVVGSDPDRALPYNKQDECDRLGFPFVDCSSWTRTGTMVGPQDLIPGCASYVFLKHLGKQLDAGDHVAVLCKVIATGRWDDDRQSVVDADLDLPTPAMDHRSVLYTGQLRDEGLL